MAILLLCFNISEGLFWIDYLCLVNNFTWISFKMFSISSVHSYLIHWGVLVLWLGHVFVSILLYTMVSGVCYIHIAIFCDHQTLWFVQWIIFALNHWYKLTLISEHLNTIIPQFTYQDVLPICCYSHGVYQLPLPSTSRTKFVPPCSIWIDYVNWVILIICNNHHIIIINSNKSRAFEFTKAANMFSMYVIFMDTPPISIWYDYILMTIDCYVDWRDHIIEVIWVLELSFKIKH